MSRWYEVVANVGGIRNKRDFQKIKNALAPWVDEWSKPTYSRVFTAHGLSGEGTYNSQATDTHSIAASIAAALAKIQKSTGILELSLSIVDCDDIPWESYIYRDEEEYAEAKENAKSESSE